MSTYLNRLEAIMEAYDCNESEAVGIMKIEFAHDELPEEDEIDRLMRLDEDD
ncbi:hypothetical protein [Paenibacillus ihuae]|uniref:hypothetical protein n=1 Tax=Paenibacillus ihuae TaxID=1232431 RepID=UPI000B103A95|nr:hypothetical protein [Paenibacillus ihuae]